MDQNPKPTDLRMMARAISLSRRGFPAPNPHVGCVIAVGEDIVGEGYHAYAGGPHAEVVALDVAGARARGATVYVTLEPCNHHGRTPPCADALLSAGVARVVVAIPDPIPAHAGGLARLQGSGVKTELGLMAGEARAANLSWLRAIERGRPYVVVKAAMTLDGRIATPTGESQWITGERARKEAHRLRAECGAVLVGRATVEQDNPRLTVRGLRIRNQPTRIVLDPGKRLSPDLRVFDAEAPTIRVIDESCGPASPADIAAESRDGSFDLSQVLALLFERKITGLLVEGGAHTIGKFIDSGLVDRLELFVAGKVFGAGKSWVERPHFVDLPSAPGFAIRNVRQVGEDLRLTCEPA